jgi:hypothetical protein
MKNVSARRRAAWRVASAVVAVTMLALAECRAAPVVAQAPLVAFGSPALEILVGPLPVLSPGQRGLSRYDARLLELGKSYADTFPQDRKDLITSVYYDLALALYTAYYRTGDARWQERARRVARTWRDAPNNRAIQTYLDSDVGADLIPPPRSMATLGLAVLALEAGDAPARQVVDLHARLIERRWIAVSGPYGLENPIMPMSDAREAGYGLMALVAATMLGDDHCAAARSLVDAILARQGASGQWQNWSDKGRPFTLNYMNGLLMEALILYDRAIGDPRIVPALARSSRWMWTTQWIRAARAFQYGNVNAGDVNTAPAPILNGLILPAWGFLAARTGDRRYVEEGDEILAGLVTATEREVHSEKQFAQAYRSSGRYLGFRVPGAGVTTAPAR